jgi:hypothetical protein
MLIEPSTSVSINSAALSAVGWLVVALVAPPGFPTSAAGPFRLT